MREVEIDLRDDDVVLDLRDEGMISEDEIRYVEDLQELQQAYSRRTPVSHPPELSSCEAIDGWGFDITERLNDGTLSEDELKMRYRVMQYDDTYEFKPVGDFVLMLERDAETRRWKYLIRALDEVLA